MARYFMHLKDGSSELIDPDGKEFVDLAALRRGVLHTARDLIRGDVEDGVIDLRFRIEAANDAGEIVYTLPFKHAVTIIPDKAEAGYVANDT